MHITSIRVLSLAVLLGAMAPLPSAARTSAADEVTLECWGPADASVGMISLPVPRGRGKDLVVDHQQTDVQPVAWWQRGQEPRRLLAFVVDDTLPRKLSLTTRKDDDKRPSAAWRVEYHTTFERLEFQNVPEWSYDALRGYPADKCTLVEGEVRLTYGGKTLALQVGATGPDSGAGGPGAVYLWQNVQVDRMWANSLVQAVRIGGVIYNSDTYLWADVYLLLFSNGVAHVTTHFVNTRLAIDGYDFRGLPLIRMNGDFAGQAGQKWSLPQDGMRHRVGDVTLDFTAAEMLCSDAEPARLEIDCDHLMWRPFSRTYNARDPQRPADYWMKGLARSASFTFSLSRAAPSIARYRVPPWWYAHCGEFGPDGLLPTRGKYHQVAILNNERSMKDMHRGRFDAGSVGYDDGAAGEGLLHAYYRTGNPAYFNDGLAHCIYWADVMFDHNDHTVHQHVAWPFKTAAYLKFRDVLYAWLETGDPYYLDNLEMTAEQQYAWFRSNWPRNSIGRDNSGLGGWAMMWRYFDTEHARDRTLELLRMNRQVVQQRGHPGGQMGAGPHPGYHGSLYMVGAAINSYLDVAATALVRQDNLTATQALDLALDSSEQFLRDDVDLYPSSYGVKRPDWPAAWRIAWQLKAMRIFAAASRWTTDRRHQVSIARGLAKIQETAAPDLELQGEGRDETRFLHPFRIGDLYLGARVDGERVVMEPLGPPRFWAHEQTVDTPWGGLQISPRVNGRQITFSFSSAAEFDVLVRFGGNESAAKSQGSCTLEIPRRRSADSEDLDN